MHRSALAVGLCLVFGLGVNGYADQNLTGAPQPDLRSLVGQYTQRELARLSDDEEARASLLRDAVFTARVEQAAAAAELLETPDVLKALAQARQRVLIDALRRYQAGLDRPPQEALDAFAQDLYAAYPEQYELPRRIRIAHISRFTDPKDPDAVPAIMRQIAERLAGGESFTALAMEFSEAPNAASGGITAQWLIAPKDLATQPAFVQRAFALTALGEVTEPFESGTGWHIILLNEDSPAARLPFESVKKAIVDDLRSDLAERRFALYLRALSPDSGAKPDTTELRKVIEARLAELDASARSPDDGEHTAPPGK